ncbi:hypothetical protein OG883_03750 [Streptomyces sp. NBC_01142]|uniref:hypothetical protein n=1 Tax=Streptomyces sp. NBC_01142 TaxID=2975865 RepID=UPI0022594612|nr:hypothetical protein [Streptomyces sp. NBC_01142]MCX4819031.1 hypothetical protein [Streptomyces sp. NBC_01142]
MFLVTARVPARALTGGDALDDRIRRVVTTEDRLEHLHLRLTADGEAQLVLFLGHADAARTEEAAALLVARALPSSFDVPAIDWEPAVPLSLAMEQLGLVPSDRELPSQDPDSQ